MKKINKMINQIRENISKPVSNKQKGFGIMSVILGIVASAIIIIIGFEAYTHAMTKIKVGQAQTQIQDISTGVDSLYSNTHDFSTISTQVVIDGGIAQKSNVVGSSIVSPWYATDASSIVTVTPGSQPTTYTIDMAAVPKDACSGVASMFLNSDNKNSITVNGTAVTDPGTLTSACASSNTAEIAISF